MRTLSRSVLPLLALALLLAGPVLLASPARADAPAGDQTVPDVVGLQVRDAEALLEQAGCPFEIEIVQVPGVAIGEVVGQDPGGLAVRPAGTTIRVRVAGGRKATQPTPLAAPPPEPPVVLPSGPPPSEPPPAEPPLEAPPSGNLPELPPVVPAAPPGVEPPGLPAAPPSEMPAEPALPALESLPAEPGPDTNGPALANTFGLSRQEAEQKLAGYQVLLEVTLTSPDMQGRVVEQHPMPGTTLALGQTVTLIFGLADEPGREYRQVPALEGLTPEKAHEKLTKTGYGVVWCTVPSPNDRAGLVVGTTPHRFSFLLKGEAVRVRVGRGTGEALPPPATEVAPAPSLPSSELPPSGELPTPAEPVPAPVEPVPAPVEPPAPPSEPPPSEPPPSEPPPSEPPPSEPPPSEPPPSEPVPAEPEPTPFLPQPTRPAPGPVTLTGPADSDSFPRAYGPTFEWRTVPNADGYEWELEQETGGRWEAARSEQLIGTKYRPARMETGRYRWRVRALNGDVPGSWADYRLLFLY